MRDESERELLDALAELDLAVQQLPRFDEVVEQLIGSYTKEKTVFEVWQIDEDGEHLVKIGHAATELSATMVMCTAFSLWGKQVQVWDAERGQAVAALGREL